MKQITKKDFVALNEKNKQMLPWMLKSHAMTCDVCQWDDASNMPGMTLCEWGEAMDMQFLEVYKICQLNRDFPDMTIEQLVNTSAVWK